jgi:hypothetical protein
VMAKPGQAQADQLAVCRALASLAQGGKRK